MSRLSRRAVLATFGAASLAGCSSLPWENESERTFDREALVEVEAIDLPSVPERIPVPIESASLDERRADVREALDAVPTEIPESDIPNGVVRSEVTQLRERATSALARAESAESAFDHLGDLRSAYTWAVGARAGYRAVTDGLTMDAVLADRPEVRGDLRAFRDRRRGGGSPDDATIVLQASVEEYLGISDRRLAGADEQRHAESRVLAVAEAAADVASARTYLADAEYLTEQFESNRETRPVGAAFERAGDELFGDLRARFEDLPPESFTENPTKYLDVQGDLDLPTRRLVTEVYREAAWRYDPEDGYWEGPASRLRFAHGSDHALRTFDRVRAAVEDGDDGWPQDAAAVRAAKLDALEALERARSDPTHPWFSNVAARRTWIALNRGNRYLEELSKGYHDGPEAVADAYAAFVRASALARTIGPANAWVLGAVETAVEDDATTE